MRRRCWTAPASWARFRFVTLPMLMPVLSVVLTFSVLFTFTDFQLVYAITRGGPANATHLMATLAFQRGIPGGQLGEGAAIADGDDPVPGRGHAIQLFRLGEPASLAARWQAMSEQSEPGSRRGKACRGKIVTDLRAAFARLRDRVAVSVLLDDDHDAEAE